MAQPGVRTWYEPAMAIAIFKASVSDLPGLPTETATASELAANLTTENAEWASPFTRDLTNWLMMVQQTTTTPIGESTTSGDPEVTRVTGKPDSGMLQVSLRRSYSANAVHQSLARYVGRYARVWVQSQDTRTNRTGNLSAWMPQLGNPIIVTDVIITDIMRIDADVAMTDASMMAMQWPITGAIREVQPTS